MVAINKQTDERNVAAGDLVCPHCFRSLTGGQIAVVTREDRYGRRLRNYVGFCRPCDKRWDVVQFKRGERWVIHKYQSWQTVGEDSMPAGDWVQLNDLPEPAPVVTGPGGDYDKQIKLKPEVVLKTKTMTLLATLRKSLESVCQAIECLMKHHGMKR